MKFELSTEQYPCYIVVNKLYIPNDEDDVPSELDLPEYHYVPADAIPTIKDDGSYHIVGKIPKLAERRLYRTREGAEKLRDKLAWSYKFEVRELMINERIRLMVNSKDTLASAPMILLDTLGEEPVPMYIHSYFAVLEMVNLPYFVDVEQHTHGRYVIMPLEVFNRDFSIVPKSPDSSSLPLSPLLKDTSMTATNTSWYDSLMKKFNKKL